MSLKTGEILRAAFIPRGYQTLLPKDIDPLAKRLARKQRMSRASLFILAAGEDHPTPQDALGMLYFAQVIKTADDVIDRTDRSFPTTANFRQFILDSELNGVNGTRVEEVLNGCLDCYSPDKQRIISSYLDEMVALHMDFPQKGVPGSYSYQEALDYRKSTDDPLLEVFAELTGSDKKRFVAIGRAWQLIEDGLDWTEDAQEDSKNLFIGMAADTWHEIGNLKGEELDYLKSILGRWQRGRMFDFRVNALLGIKSSHVRRTREKYKQEVLNEIPRIGGKMGRLIEVAGHMLFN